MLVSKILFALLLLQCSYADIITGSEEDSWSHFPFPFPVEQLPNNPGVRTAEWFKSFKDLTEIGQDESVTLHGNISLSSTLVGEEYTVSGILPGPELDTLYILRRRQDPITGFSEFSEGTYSRLYEGAIQVNCVLLLNISTSGVISSFGDDMFYYPNAMVKDPQGNFWFSDAGRHQVLQVNASTHVQDIAIGEEFAPGSGNRRLCAPTDVAVTSKHVYVADGHCNNRVVLFNKTGGYIAEFGAAPSQTVLSNYRFGRDIPMRFIVKPQALAVDEQTDRLYIAESGQSRVVIVKAGADEGSFGTEIRFIEHPKLRPEGGRLALHPDLPRVFVLNSYSTVHLHRGFTFNTHDASFVGAWGPDPRGFVRPRAISVRAEDSTVFVSDATEESPERIWIFRTRAHRNTRFIHDQKQKGYQRRQWPKYNNDNDPSSFKGVPRRHRGSHNNRSSSLYRFLSHGGTKGRG